MGRVSAVRPSIRVTVVTVPGTDREVQGRLHVQLHEQALALRVGDRVRCAGRSRLRRAWYSLRRR
jgi:hypothetical protein